MSEHNLEFPAGVDLARTINMTLQRALCPRHGEHFRPQWPKGYMIFVVKARSILLKLESFAQAVANADGGFDVRKIEAALDSMPMCCRLTPEDLCGILNDCGIGKIGVCGACGRVATGTEYFTQHPSEPLPKKYANVCFQCSSGYDGGASSRN